MKVILLLQVCQTIFRSTAKQRSIPDTIARGEAVLEVVDGVTGALADNTLMRH